MNQAVKVLVIFVTVASLSFMALTGAVTLGGPNWWGRSQEMKDYTFEVTSGETTTYKVTHRPTGEPVNVSKSSIHAAAVVGALEDQKRRQTARVQELDEAIARQEGFVKALENYQQQAVAQMESRTKEFQEQLNQLNQTIETRNAEIDKILEETYALNESLGERREDVLRLRNQLALIRTDRDRLVAQRQELEDILVLLNASLDQLERRTQQLQNQN
jgi:hypothetical protein